MREINMIVIHCSATQAEQNIGAAKIKEWHLDRGFNDIGYHYVIKRDGMVERGRSDETIGAHVQGFNAKSIGVCMVGGANAAGKGENNFTPQQWAALTKTLNTLKSKYPLAKVVGHRDLSPDLNKDGKITPNEYVKGCPAFDVGLWIISQRKKGEIKWF
jgi:N-acetyl-anhydromuramyl-L-alanine amidase AmpD